MINIAVNDSEVLMEVERGFAKRLDLVRIIINTFSLECPKIKYFKKYYKIYYFNRVAEKISFD